MKCVSSIFVRSFEIPTMNNDSEKSTDTHTENETVVTQETTIFHEHNLSN